MESVVRRVLELDALRAKVVCSDDDMPDPLQQALRHWRKGGVRGDRIRTAMMNKALRGEGLGKPPYGYAIGSDGRLEVVPEESEAVRLIYRMYNRGGVGLRRIVRSLNEKGVPTRGGRGWSLVTVRDVLRNRTYLGTYTRFGLRVPANHPAIIDREEFRLAQEKMEQGRTRRRMSYPSEPFLLSGLAYCANCGNRMMGVSRRQGWRRKDGTRSVGQYRYYQCQSRANQGTCGYHTWRAGVLEQAVLREARDALERGDLAIDAAEYLARKAATGGNGLQSDARFMRELENAAAGFTSLDRLRSVVAELDDETNGRRRQPAGRGAGRAGVRRRRGAAAGVGRAGGGGRRSRAAFAGVPRGRKRRCRGCDATCGLARLALTRRRGRCYTVVALIGRLGDRAGVAREESPSSTGQGAG